MYTQLLMNSLLLLKIIICTNSIYKKVLNEVKWIITEIETNKIIREKLKKKVSGDWKRRDIINKLIVVQYNNRALEMRI